MRRQTRPWQPWATEWGSGHLFTPLPLSWPYRHLPLPGPARPGRGKFLGGWPTAEQKPLPTALASPLPPWLLQLLQTTNNSPMNSKPQQIKMQSTKKGPLTKREEGGPSGGPAVGAPPPGDEACSLGAAQPAASSSLQLQVSVLLGWAWASGHLQGAGPERVTPGCGGNGRALVSRYWRPSHRRCFPQLLGVSHNSWHVRTM